MKCEIGQTVGLAGEKRFQVSGHNSIEHGFSSGLRVRYTAAVATKA